MKFTIDPVDYLPAYRAADKRRLLAAKLAEWLISEAGENVNRTSRDLGEARKVARYIGAYIDGTISAELQPQVRLPIAKEALRVVKMLYELDTLERHVTGTMREIALMSPYVYDLMREQKRARELSPELGDAVETALEAKEVSFAKQMIRDFLGLDDA